ncbi:unnamed protein product [Mytilus coruscus]|uniref:Dynamin N-terminal domain-containing protein n=1 Tax=Mytilus coruscus TaxID=42192 RepID=A0A6J8ATU7_MYTCO|nr:unnamed protein product [Mytilus coruscus]
MAASKQCDSDRNDTKENYRDTWIPPKNELDDSLIDIAASMQCDSDWCSNADTQDLKENCKDSRLSTKNELDDSLIDIAASMQCDSDWCSNADTQDLKENCKDSRFSTKNDLDDTCINIAASMQCDSGKTSAGKTTLINQLVGKNVFVTGILPTTGKITRIRNSQTMKIRCYSKDETITKEKEVQDVKNLKSIIKNLSHIQMRSRYLPDIYFVDVYLPVPILKGNVIIVDTPAIGENESLDNILLDYLPYAVSFVFVVNAKQHSSGIHENKLLKFLKTIMDNREKMPCFDPREVLFLTNQWDLIENYDSSSEVDDDNFWEKNDQHTQTWLEKGLITISLPNTRLQETIEKNKNKRVEFYYRFLKDFIRNAERGTLARLQMLKKSEEQQGIINQNILKIRYLQTKCQESSKELERYKNTIITKLAEKLYHYLNSPCGREDILNPSETKRICEVSYKFQLEEVPSRLKSGINDGAKDRK